jgi:hypothetical protein
VTSSSEAQLRKENDELRKLIVQLGITTLRAVRESGALLWTVLERRSLRTLPSAMASPLPEEIAPSEMVLYLRDAALQYIRLSRASADSRTAQQFEALSLELADVAQRLKILFDDPRTIQRTIS